MPISITCPGCSKTYSVKDELAGKRGKCTTCGQFITVPGASTPAAAITPPPAKQAVVKKVPPPANSSRWILISIVSGAAGLVLVLGMIAYFFRLGDDVSKTRIAAAQPNDIGTRDSQPIDNAGPQSISTPNPTQAPESIVEKWESSWKQFATAIAPHLARSVDSFDSQVKAEFDGKEILWEGTVSTNAKYSEEQTFQMEMRPQTLKIHSAMAEGGLATDDVRVIQVKAKMGSLAAWNKVPPGTKIRFRGVLKEPIFIVLSTGTGEHILFVVNDAEPDLASASVRAIPAAVSPNVATLPVNLLQEVPAAEATPNPSSGDTVAVSIYDRLTAKIAQNDVPEGSYPKLGEYASSLDLSQSSEREKVIRKWQELGGPNADRHEVTIWNGTKQYRWPARRYGSDG